MSRPDPKQTGPRNMAVEIRELDRMGIGQREIARRLGCSSSNVSQVLSRANDPAPRMSDGITVNRFRRKAPPETCQRPDVRKGFETCGDPKKRTACGELLGVCEFHFETTKPLGGMKL